MSQVNAINPNFHQGLQVSYKRERDSGSIVEQYLGEVTLLLKRLKVMNQAVSEESQNDTLVKDISNESGAGLNLVGELTEKLKVLLNANKQSNHIDACPKMLLAEVKDKCQSKLTLERLSLSQMYIRMDHELLVSAFISVVEVLGGEEHAEINLSYDQNETLTKFEFYGGTAILTDSLTGAYALELLRSMDATVKWASGNVQVSFKSTGSWLN